MNKAEQKILDATRKVAAKASGIKKNAEAKLQGVGRTIRKNAGSFAADIKKNGIHPMDDKGIIGPKIIKEVKEGKRARR